MKSSIKYFLGFAIAAALTIAASTSRAAPAAEPAPGKATVVLVHGAFADGSGWSEVIRLLRGRGLNVVAVQNPLTSLADDVAATPRMLDVQEGAVVLVGHSWGGVVISEAGVHERVKSLVYVAAFAPSEGQSVADLTKGYPTPPGSKFVVADKAGFLSLSPEGMAKHFAQDLPAAQTSLMTVTQVPIRASSFEEKSTAAAWRTRPVWYVQTRNDRMIDPGLQSAMARGMHAHVVSVSSSHVPQLSRPVQVADAIVSAAQQAK